MLLLSLLLLTAPGTWADHHEGHHDDRYDVIILGGGLAGVAAAQELFVRNESFVVLEARDRIGGRIHSINPDYDHKVLDLGASYILGEGDNPFYVIAEKTKNLRKGFEDNKGVFLSNGRILDRSGKKLKDLLDTINQVSDRRICDGRSFECLRDQIEFELANSGKYGKGEKEIWMALLERLLVTKYNGMDLKHLSFDTVNEQQSFPGSQRNTWKRGFKTVLDFLLGERGEVLDHIKMKKEVVNVAYGSGGVEVKCKDGSTYRGEKVLVTLPLGVLKSAAHKLFHPPLPSRKTKAIEALGVNNYNKVFLEYHQPWWSEDMTGFYVAHDEEERKQLAADHGDWVLDTVDFQVAEAAPNYLWTWVTGKSSHEVENKQERDVLRGVHAVVSKVFSNATKPARIIRTKWESDPYSLGSNTYISMEAQRQGVTIEDLKKPIHNAKGEVVVAFAGEGADTEHFGTAHGALRSGLIAVKQLFGESEHDH